MGGTVPLPERDSPFWSGIAGSVELAETCFDWGSPMLECLARPSSFPASSVRIDFPGHFISKGRAVKTYGTESMLFPPYRYFEKVKDDADYAVNRQRHPGMGKPLRRHSGGRLRGPAHGLVQALAFHGRCPTSVRTATALPPAGPWRPCGIRNAPCRGGQP